MKYGLPLICLLLIAAWSCDEIASTEDSAAAIIQSLSVSPNEFTFSGTTEIKDTTLSVELNLLLKEPSDLEFSYSAAIKNEQISEGLLQKTGPVNYSQLIELDVNTAVSQNISVFIYSPQSPQSESAEAAVRIQSDITEPPVIQEAFNTETVQIPETGRERIDFFARVTHPGGQMLVDRVDFFMIDQNGNRLGGEDQVFRLYDDGVFDEQAGRIDEAAGDSLYSRALFIEPENNPANINVFYFATSSNGISSDTLQATLQIVE